MFIAISTISGRFIAKAKTVSGLCKEARDERLIDLNAKGQLAKAVAELIDVNDHTEAAILMAESMGDDLGDAMATVLREIADQHELIGHMTPNLQRTRDGLSAMVDAHLTVRGLI